jgi:MFS family permease
MVDDRDTGSGRQEFAQSWPTLLAAASGVGLGVSGLLTYNSGLFVHALTAEIGLTRTGYGAALFTSTLAMAVAMPVVARIVDRHGPRLAATAGGLMLALGFLAMALLARSIAAYWTIMLLIGLLASASSPVAYTRAVSAFFVRSRGLALGFVQMGIGVSAALVPPLVSGVIAGSGWRAGYIMLAGLALLGCLPALLGLPGRERSRVGPPTPADFRAAVNSRTFRVQLAAFSTMALAFAGMLAHFVPMLRESGASAVQAGALASLIGVSVIVTRVIVGWLADRVEAAWLGAASCVVCSLGCLAMGFGGPNAAPVAAVALGAAMGAEADLIGYLTARHFGLAAYSRAYALQYAAFMVAAGFSPIWVGAVADQMGSYRSPLLACSGLLLVPIILFLLLPRVYRAERARRAA